MDALGVLFLIIFLIILTISNIFFIKGLRKNNIRRFKYKLVFFLMCIISLFVAMVTFYIFQTSILIDLFNLEIDNDSYRDRIISAVAVIILNTTTNLILIKFYLKKIYSKENTKTNEIESIGIE